MSKVRILQASPRVEMLTQMPDMRIEKPPEPPRTERNITKESEVLK
jgi:hypothetical protein